MTAMAATRSGREILDMLRRMSSHDGITVVMVTHDPAAAAVADRVVFLRHGKVADEVAAPATVPIRRRSTPLGGFEPPTVGLEGRCSVH
jgi:putative ABC transport system ATP-binding protein